MKTCAKCGEEKPRSEYHKKKSTRDGLQPKCKACVRAYQLEWSARPDVRQRQREWRDEYQRRPDVAERKREYMSAWYEENKEWVAEYRQAHYEANRATILESKREYYSRPEVKERLREYKGRYYAENRDQILEQKREYHARPDVKKRVSEYKREYHMQNRDRLLEAGRAWYWNNREHALAKMREYRAENGDYLRAKNKEWRSENPHHFWERCYMERCASYGVTPVVQRFTKQELIDTYGDACVDCGNEWTDLDHVVPVRFGGPHILDNCQPVCHPCNMARWGTYQREALDLLARMYIGEAA